MRRLALTLMITLSSLAVAGQRTEAVNIVNRTMYEDAQEIAEIIAHEILCIDTLDLIILSLPSSSTLLGAVVKNKVEPHKYVILLNQSLSLKKLRLTMSHEFVHIKQYESEGLEIFGDIWSWNPDGVVSKQDVTWGSMTFTGYEIRGFEIDAKRREAIVNKELLQIIKGKK